MSINDGQKLQVFGLGFAQHDNRNMQQVLRHYNHMPSDPGSRTALFVELSKLARELSADDSKQEEVRSVTSWMQHGGEFPLGAPPPQVQGTAQHHQQPDHHQQYPPLGGFIPHHYPDGRSVPHTNTTSRYGRGRRLGEEPGPMFDDPDSAVEEPYEHAGDWDTSHSDSGEITNRVGSHHSHQDTDGQQNLDQTPEDEDDRSYQPSDRDAAHEADSDIDSMPSLVPVPEDDMDEDWEEPRPPVLFDHPPSNFPGRGHTFNDAAEADTADDGSAATNVRAQGTNTIHGRPQLRAHQGWRGNNVAGFGNADLLAGQLRGMGMGMGRGRRGGMPMMPRQRRLPVPAPNGWNINNEEDDEFGPMGHHGIFGPGRALNDPAPDPAAGNQDEATAQQETQEDASDEDLDVAGERPENADGEELECPICIGSYPLTNFPKRGTITDLCDHPDLACHQCLQASISETLKRGALHLLACPICPQQLTRQDIKEYAAKPDYKRYKYLKAQSEIPGHWISCTNTACGGSQPAPEEGMMMVCRHCQFATCAKHRLPWHEDMTCAEFDMDPAQMERLEEEEATAKLLATEATSICPKCGQGVTKTEGCDHMMCQCGTEWCYVCSCSWENILRLGGIAHATFCIYHPNKVNLSKDQQEAARRRIMGLVHGGEVSAELTRARDAFRQRRREEMRPKLLEAAEARQKQALEERKKNQGEGPSPARKKRKVKLVAPWEEGGVTKKAL